MNTIKFSIIFCFLIFVFSNLLSAEMKYGNAVHVIMEDFETIDQWNIDFSSLKCQEWKSPDWVRNNNDSADGATTAQNAEQNNNTPWIKWLNTDTVDPVKKLTYLPLEIQSSFPDNKTVLGIKGCWNQPGYNWVSIAPKTPMYTPIDPVNFSIYVWGNNYKYDLYLTIKNTENMYYSLFISSLNFSGWKELKINFPNYIFPRNNHNSNSKLEIVNLKVFGRPNEDAHGFYAYFDHIVVQKSLNPRGLYNGSSLLEEQW